MWGHGAGETNTGTPGRHGTKPGTPQGGLAPRRERPRYLTEPAVMPATRNRWSSRKPTTIGTLTVSDAAMIWFQ
jgi:hypothetical protein